MRKDELSYLHVCKEKEGKCDDEVVKEINDLVHAQKLFKILNLEVKKLGKIIQSKDKEIEKLKNIQQKHFLKGLGQEKEVVYTNNKTFSRTANVNQLKRILCLISSEERLNASRLSKSAGMTQAQTKSALLFLLNHKLIKKDGIVYTISE